MKTLLFLVVLAPFAVYTEAKPQTVTVKGTTICNKKRLSGALVELMERDTLDPNDLLQSKSTSSEGEFLVTGSEDEFGSIEPYLRITHNCNVKKPGCKRVSEFVVPSSKIGGVYDMTYVTLDILSSVDKEKC